MVDLTRPDVGEYFSLTYQQKESSRRNSCFLDREEKRVNKFQTMYQSVAATYNERVTLMNADNPMNKHYHKDAKKQQDELISKLSLYKQIKQNNKNLARRNHIIDNRHKTGLLGSDSPEKQTKVPKVFAKKSEQQKKHRDGFAATMDNRF